MKKTILAALGVMAFGAAAHGAYASDFYAGWSAGASVMENGTDHGVGGDVSVKHGTGFSVSGVVGDVVGPVRVEGEIGYRQAAFDRVAVGGQHSDASGNASSVSALANVWYDIPVGSSVTPYVGGGAGLASVSADHYAIGGNAIANDQDVRFAWQLGGGVQVPVTDHAKLDVGYRHFETTDPTFTTVFGTTYRSEFATDEATVGLRYAF